ncbi:pyrroloquinoline quinone biosynthesis peptide chaperone PqqD [Kibdelosporangium persicum]|uniref:Pyrroloquinoline quinone biosynthesis protein Dpyrroloquinoline quinone biosynthesis protein D n=2 Tax=Kibdelosporangium persicum TaxID=2698649 RepID=A0ABX2FFC4_9PSEU|nr:pyrroloquinoline quinone biosynthesis peptide chaperone PqqD [Kibdelosporangium persicum]NRN69918.1 Pyrroloquinoline quinone biosynthesis protein Dpyrroloquinoline quinone biosynthesis protein D [Kibdelosporangium persicum]
MSMIGLDSAPRLRRGVRLTYDKTRETHVLLFPEGVLVPNKTAAAVLELCDGVATVAEIAAELGRRYEGVRVEDVRNVLTRLEERRVVEWK